MHINPNIEKPIFIQIAEQLEDSIFTKVFPEETKIPSTNELSSLLNINLKRNESFSRRGNHIQEKRVGHVCKKGSSQ